MSLISRGATRSKDNRVIGADSRRPSDALPADDSAGEFDARALVEEHVRRGRQVAIRTRVAQLLILIGLLAAWEITSRYLIDAFWISSPGSVLQQSWEWAVTGFIWSHALITFQEMALGLVLGAAAGLAVGILLGVKKRLATTFDPFVMVAFAIPNLALTPLFILFFGIGMTSKVALVATVVFFFIFYNTFAGVRDVNPDLVNTVRIMGGSQLRVVWSVLLPSATGWILTGLRLAVRQALAAAVVGEMIAGNAGLGYLLARSAGTFDATGVFAALVFVTLIAVALNGLAALAEQHLTRWKR